MLRFMSSAGQKNYTVLIVDDSKVDRFLIRQVIQRFPRFNIIGELQDGEEVVDYLSGKGAFAEREKFPVPDLMLLDLNMPKMDGFDVLRWLKSQSLPSLTVIILSGSTLGEDIGASLALGAHGYWTKAINAARQNDIVREIEELLDQRRTLLTSAS